MSCENILDCKRSFLIQTPSTEEDQDLEQDSSSSVRLYFGTVELNGTL